MSTATPMKRAEQRLFHAYWDDGLLDLLAGASVALIGASWLADVFVVGLAMPIIAIVLWQALRRQITEPRFGRLTFSDSRQHKLKHGLIAIVSLGLVVGGNLVTRIWLVDSPTPFSTWFAPAIPATIIAAMALSCGVALGLRRFLLYGLLFGFAGLIMALLQAEPWWALVVVGLLIMGCGGVMLARFVRRHPVLDENAER